MEMDSSSFADSGGASASSDSSSLNGLKFGKKIYFEDVGIGVSGKSSGGSSSNLVSQGGRASSIPVRKGRGVPHGGVPPRCQVEGCKLDLSDVKAYYARHKVCSMHSKSPKVIVGGLEQRFCQQCSRFHLLSEFDQGKRSCRRRLAGHNERRRKPQPGSLFSSRYGRLTSSYPENSSRVGGYLMDFTTYPRLTGRDTDAWPGGNQQGSSAAIVYSSPYLHGTPGPGTIYSSTRVVPSSGECCAGVSDSSCALSLLSNQPWGSSMAQSTAPHSAAARTDFNTSFGLAQGPSQTINSHFSGELELAQQQGDRQYMELVGSSAAQMHWSL